MFKKSLFALVATGVMVLAGAAQAQYCGGTIEHNGDIANNGRGWGVSCCPDGYRVQGIACADLPPDQDMSDGCSAVCRSISKGNIMMPSHDFQRQPGISQCPKQDVFAGIVCKDTDKHGGGANSDALDGCTAVCQHPGSSSLNVLPNGDIDGNSRGTAQVTVQLPKRVVGIACKDLAQGSSDRNDSCTIITK